MADDNIISIISKSGMKIEEIEILEVAAHLFLKQLNKKRKFNTICVDIQIVDDIVSESSSEALCGDMEEIKNFLVDNNEIKGYYICRIVDYLNSAEVMRTLAHELVHVWQTATGRLKTNEKGWYWLGQFYGEAPYVGNDEDYSLPWEREADTLDIQLTKRFYNQYFSKW